MTTAKISTGTKIVAQILGSYTNSSQQLQIIRIVTLEGCWFERVIFPRERILFEAPSNADLEVYIGQFGQSILIEKMSVDNLLIEQPSSEQTTKGYHQLIPVCSNLFLDRE